MEITDNDKIKILKKYGYEAEVGICFNNPTDQDYENQFVPKEEVEEKLKDGYKTYFIREYGEFFMELEDAWEDFIDWYWDEFHDKFDNDENKMYESLKKFL